MAKVGFRIDTVQPARSDKTIQQGTTFTTMIAAEEDVVFLAKTDRSKRTLSCVIIRLCQAIIAVVAQGIPLVQGIRERFTQTGLFRERRAFFYQPLMQGCQQWFALGLSSYQPLSCRETTYGFFDCVQLTDTFQDFLCCRPSEYLYRRRGFFCGRGPSWPLLLTGRLHALR